MLWRLLGLFTSVHMAHIYRLTLSSGIQCAGGLELGRVELYLADNPLIDLVYK